MGLSVPFLGRREGIWVLETSAGWELGILAGHRHLQIYGLPLDCPRTPGAFSHLLSSEPSGSQPHPPYCRTQQLPQLSGDE